MRLRLTLRGRRVLAWAAVAVALALLVLTYDSTPLTIAQVLGVAR